MTVFWLKWFSAYVYAVFNNFCKLHFSKFGIKSQFYETKYQYLVLGKTDLILKTPRKTIPEYWLQYGIHFCTWHAYTFSFQQISMQFFLPLKIITWKICRIKNILKCLKDILKLLKSSLFNVFDQIFLERASWLGQEFFSNTFYLLF